MSDSTKKHLNTIIALMLVIMSIAIINFIRVQRIESLAWSEFERQLQEPGVLHIAGYDRITTYLSLRTYSLLALIAATVAAIFRNAKGISISSWFLVAVLCINVMWALNIYKHYDPLDTMTPPYVLREATLADIFILFAVFVVFIYERIILRGNSRVNKETV